MENLNIEVPPAFGQEGLVKARPPLHHRMRRQEVHLDDTILTTPLHDLRFVKGLNVPSSDLK